MLYHLLTPLTEYSILFNLFRYTTFRALMAAVTSFVLTMVLIPPFIRWIRRRGLGEVILEDLAHHAQKQGTPTSGGLVFISATLLATLLWARWDIAFVWVALAAVAALTGMGFLDDLAKLRDGKSKGLSKRQKLLVQGVVAVGVFLFVWRSYGDLAFATQMLFLKNYVLYFGWLYPLFLWFVFVGTSNAVNLTDGLDGLAAGTALAPLGVLMAVAYIQGHVKLSGYLNVLYQPGMGELAVFAATLTGALLAFLWYNAHPAEIFMGDTGSQGLGAAFAVLAILTKQELLLAVAGGVFVMEAVSVLIQVASFRYFGRRRVFRMAPLHHHFEKKGWAETKIVVRFWILSMIFSLLALATLKIR